MRDSGSKEDEADTVYLLAKELAYDVVNNQADRLGDALARYQGKDIVPFANAVKISHPKIDEKVCSGDYAKGADSGGNTNVTSYSDDPTVQTKTAQCSGLKNKAEGKTAGGLSKFVDLTKIGENKNWPTGKVNKNNNTAVDGDTKGNAEAVAKDLVQELNRDEKTIVAGLLAKTIEGGEVVEIRAVSSTSVMVNACYDLLSEGLGVVPYACVGLGGNFVGVVDGHITIYLYLFNTLPR
ncbi:P44/Msp2 family outer membrane protein [Anaplasma phagocytophilum str. Norway variant1]|uniref:P44/Msp2 family outer membrane protein n=1 Tax=Anaplasma phagocytophilum str. Norway variant1 TaxID=1392506 RepID=A0A7H9DZJ9_ANAPH|nr:P44/Msp2 family outer membrane protein [Anaplasma phagocytophilum str. Norway variant1]